MAVYTHISQFDVGALQSFSGITSGVSNTNYLLNTTKGRFILTLFEARTPAEDLPFCLEFMAHLNACGIPCPNVVPDKKGAVLTIMKGKPAVIITFLEGQSPLATQDFHAAALGRALAQMHLAAEHFSKQQTNALALPAWRKLLTDCGTRLNEIEPDLRGLIFEELGHAEAHWPKNLPRGAIHADLFRDNVFFNGKNLSGVIDFYFSCTDFFAYDLMVTVNAWFFNADGLPEKSRIAAFLDAYQKERPLSAEEKAALPFLGRAATLRYLATRCYDWLHPAKGAIITPHDPREYVRILKFYQTGTPFL